jgi:hypothetical protein
MVAHVLWPARHFPRLQEMGVCSRISGSAHRDLAGLIKHSGAFRTRFSNVIDLARFPSWSSPVIL